MALMDEGSDITYQRKTAPEAPVVDSKEAPVRVLFVVNELSPYRIHKLQRFATEISEIQPTTLVTHEIATSNWRITIPPQIDCTIVGRGRRAQDQSKLVHAYDHWRVGAQVIRWIQDHDPKVVMIFGYGDPGHLRVMHWCHTHHIPCLLWADSNVHGDQLRGWRQWLKRRLMRRVLKWSDRLLVCGRLGTAYFARYGARSDNIYYVPNEPDYDEFRSPERSSVSAIMEEYRLQVGRRRLIYCGRLAPAKRVDLLIDAFCRIATTRPEWDLVVVGEGSAEGALRERVPACLQERVTWTGFVAQSVKVAALYAASDALVLPSDFEPWALVINEAAASGLAIVTSSIVGAAPELVHEDVNGYTFKSGDVADLKRCLLLVTDATKIDRLKTGSTRVLEAWRRAADPIDGLRRALRSVGAIS